MPTIVLVILAAGYIGLLFFKFKSEMKEESNTVESLNR